MSRLCSQTQDQETDKVNVGLNCFMQSWWVLKSHYQGSLNIVLKWHQKQTIVFRCLKNALLVSFLIYLHGFSVLMRLKTTYAFILLLTKLQRTTQNHWLILNGLVVTFWRVNSSKCFFFFFFFFNRSSEHFLPLCQLRHPVRAGHTNDCEPICKFAAEKSTTSHREVEYKYCQSQ